MQFARLSFATLAFLCAVYAFEPVSTTLATAPLVMGGLAVLKGLSVWYLLGQGGILPFPFRIKRSVPGLTAGGPFKEEEERFLLSKVEDLDPSGCILKLICHLQFKDEASRTNEENILVKMFANKSQGVNTFRAPYVFASEVGNRNVDAAVCESYFSKCPLKVNDISELLRESWGCGV